MNKAEMISKLQADAGLTKFQATAALQSIEVAVTEVLVNGGEVTLQGLGKFTTQEKAARVGRNPQTGEPLEIPASRVVKFKVGKALKDAVGI